MPAKKGNLNAFKSGRRTSRAFAISMLGDKFDGIRQRLQFLRNRMEAIYTASYGAVDIDAEAAMSAVIRSEMVALIAMRGIREGQGDALAQARIASQATMERNRSLARLGLSAKRRDGGIDWESILSEADPAESAWDKLDQETQAEEEAARLAAGDQDGEPTNPPGDAVGDQDPDPNEASAAAVADPDLDGDGEPAESLTPSPRSEIVGGGSAGTRAPSPFRFQNSDSAD